MQLSVPVDKDQTTQQECLHYHRLVNLQISIRVEKSAVACEEKENHLTLVLSSM